MISLRVLVLLFEKVRQKKKLKKFGKILFLFFSLNSFVFEKYVVYGAHTEVYFAQYSNEKLDDELLKAWNVFFSSLCQSGRPIQCDSMLVLSAFVCDRSIKSTIKWWMCLKQMKPVCSMFVFTAKKLEQSKRQKKRKYTNKEIQLKRYFKQLKKGKNAPKMVQRDKEVKNKAEIRNE